VVTVIVTAVRRGRARRRAGPPVTGPWPPVTGAPGAPAPVQLGFAGPARQARGTVLFRAILAIPALTCVHLVRYVAGVILVTGWFGALFTGRLPGYAVIRAAPPAAAAPASASPAPLASPAPAPSSAPSGQPLSAVSWLTGLSSLSARMNRAMGAGNQVLTSASLRTTARKLGRCRAGLSALGPPAAQLRHVDRLAVRACQGFEQGARYLAAAARFVGSDGSVTDQPRVSNLLDRGDAGVNRGSRLIATAVADGAFIAPPG
jgi:hypothetical protein